jgi:hypothetical protein
MPVISTFHFERSSADPEKSSKKTTSGFGPDPVERPRSGGPEPPAGTTAIIPATTTAASPTAPRMPTLPIARSSKWFLNRY